MRIGVAWEPGSNAQYRALQPVRAMMRRGHDVMGPPSTEGEAVLERLAQCEVVHIYRRVDTPTQQVMRELMRRGIAIVYDNDDDFTTLPKESPAYKRWGGLAGQQLFQVMVQIAKAARVFTTTNERLADKYRAAGVERVAVIGNYLIPDMPRPRRPHEGIVIGWIGGVDHRADVARIPIVDAFERLLDKHDHVRVEAIGVDLGLSRRYRHDSIVEFEELPERMGGWDIGIAPLSDIPFNLTRSDIKVKEYAASGVPWLASPIGPYVGLGEGQGGQLVPDDGWFDALDGLVSTAKGRRRLAKAGLAWAQRNTIDVVADRWEQVFANAIASAGSNVAPPARPRPARVKLPPGFPGPRRP